MRKMSLNVGVLAQNIGYPRQHRFYDLLYVPATERFGQSWVAWPGH